MGDAEAAVAAEAAAAEGGGGNRGSRKGDGCGDGGGRGDVGWGRGAGWGGGAVSGCGGSGSTARVQVRYDAHMLALSLWDRENFQTILAGTVLPTVQGHIICKNWHLCGLC